MSLSGPRAAADEPRPPPVCVINNYHRITDAAASIIEEALAIELVPKNQPVLTIYDLIVVPHAPPGYKTDDDGVYRPPPARLVSSISRYVGLYYAREHVRTGPISAYGTAARDRAADTDVMEALEDVRLVYKQWFLNLPA